MLGAIRVLFLLHLFSSAAEKASACVKLAQSPLHQQPQMLWIHMERKKQMIHGDCATLEYGLAIADAAAEMLCFAGLEPGLFAQAADRLALMHGQLADSEFTTKLFVMAGSDAHPVVLYEPLLTGCAEEMGDNATIGDGCRWPASWSTRKVCKGTSSFSHRKGPNCTWALCLRTYASRSHEPCIGFSTAHMWCCQKAK